MPRHRPVEIDDINPHRQRLIRKTDRRGNHPYARMWVLRCTDSVCAHEYGANSCDFHLRLCPIHQDGKPGLPIEGV